MDASDSERLTSQRSWRIIGCCGLGLWDISDLSKVVMADGWRRRCVECRVDVNRRRQNAVVPVTPSFARYQDMKSTIYC